jgi:short-subunit dehydrogenase
MADKTNRKTILVSGASSGIGRAIAGNLAVAGHRVFGTSRSPDKSEKVAHVEMRALDVCSDKSVDQCVTDILGETDGIDVLVNNAGYALMGPAEATSAAEARAQFETNYFGLARLTNAVLPAMRARKSGRIINISSLVGFAAIPFMAHYSASKFALEGYTEALYQELLPFGVKVSLIQPGITGTELFGDSGTRVQTAIVAYSPWMQQARASMADRTGKAISADHVARAVAKAIAARNPALRIPVGPDAGLVSRLKRYVPPETFKKIWRKQMGLG